MNETKTKKQRREDRIDTIIGIITVVSIFAIFALVIAFAGNKTVGTIAYEGETRKGHEQVFTYNNPSLKKGDTVKWFVGNECLASYTYNGENASFAYTPAQVGTTMVRVSAGKYNQATTVQVQKPLLTLTARDATVTYGEEIPLEFDCEGLLGEDTLESLGYNFTCRAEGNGCCGVSEITLEQQPCENCDYEICCKNGCLTVLPREISIANTITKVYDQTDTLLNPNIIAEGVLEGDDVRIVADKLTFESKNVGEQTLNASDLRLEGADSDKYVLCGEIVGEIVPKAVVLQGLTIADKYYDGTNKAKISKLGNLQGVLDGDSIAIGSLEVSFADASVGVQKIDVKKASLVGFDKDNYVLTDIVVNNANILSAD